MGMISEEGASSRTNDHHSRIGAGSFDLHVSILFIELQWILSIVDAIGTDQCVLIKLS